MLLWASEVVYGEGITSLVNAAGPAAGLTRLAGVCLDDLADTDVCAHITLQWEAIAADGTLFSAPEADLMLVPAGHQIALALAGAYRPQPGRAGAWHGSSGRARVCRRGRPQFPGPGGVRPGSSRGHGTAGRS